jgi:hypothetical protein
MLPFFILVIATSVLRVLGAAGLHPLGKTGDRLPTRNICDRSVSYTIEPNVLDVSGAGKRKQFREELAHEKLQNLNNSNIRRNYRYDSLVL